MQKIVTPALRQQKWFLSSQERIGDSRDSPTPIMRQAANGVSVCVCAAHVTSNRTCHVPAACSQMPSGGMQSCVFQFARKRHQGGEEEERKNYTELVIRLPRVSARHQTR